jgi:small basic protein
VGIVAGFVAMLIWPWTLPVGLAPYLAIAFLAGFDSVIGAVRGHLDGQYDERIFVSGFFTNAVLAVLLGYLGDLVGVNLVLAAEVAFGVRIFHNLGRIRRNLLTRWTERPVPPSAPEGSAGARDEG